MSLAFWNNGSPRVVRRTHRVALPNGDVMLNATVSPENDLYYYAEAGALPTAYETAGSVNYENDGWTVTANRNVLWRPLEDIKDIRLRELADRRFVVETGGLMFNGDAMPTNDRAKALILGAHTKALGDAAYSVDWKVAPGSYVTLDAAAISSLWNALETHVSAAFANEQTHAAALLALTDEQAVVDYDITTGWPENPQ